MSERSSDPTLRFPLMKRLCFKNCTFKQEIDSRRKVLNCFRKNDDPIILLMDFNDFICRSPGVIDPLVRVQTWIFAAQTVILFAQLVVFGFQLSAFRHQARTLQKTVDVADGQFKAMQQENNKNAFFDLLPEVANLTIPSLPSTHDSRIETAYMVYLRRPQAEHEDDRRFLHWFSEQLHGISESDHFRRSSLFGAFARLYDDADKARKQLFRDALCSRIGDELARTLILQAVRERDEAMLTIFGKFPIAFENLHRMPTLMEELVDRFAKSFKDEIMGRAKSIDNQTAKGWRDL
jgi:hypothetical protein